MENPSVFNVLVNFSIAAKLTAVRYIIN